jgi:hypothetical protein
VTKVAVLDTEVQAQRVGGVLTDRGIPHILRSYHDSAYDGLFQGMRGWGHVEAEEQYHAEILAVLEDIVRQSGSLDDQGP